MNAARTLNALRIMVDVRTDLLSAKTRFAMKAAVPLPKLESVSVFVIWVWFPILLTSKVAILSLLLLS